MLDDPHSYAPRTMDAALETLLHASSEEERRQAVETLVVEVARDVVDPILRRIARAPSRELHDELRSEVVIRLLARLQLLSGRGIEPISNFDDYAAVVTYSVHADYWRRFFPERARLKDRLRYVFGRDRRFETVSSNGRTICRLVGDDPGPDVFEEVTVELARHAAEILQAHDGVLSLDDLADAVGERHKNDSRGFFDGGASIDPSPQERIENVESLRDLWREIVALPVKQRVALLLNLRDAEGDPAVLLLPVTGVASVREIATALELEDEQFATLWNNVPISDAEIALLLGVSRQQVINLRKSARERLARRMSRPR